MSKIKVWVEPEGNWSKPFIGLDKIHIIKEALVFECRKHYCEEENWSEVLTGLEIDAVEIEVSEREYKKYDIEALPEEMIGWGLIEKSNGISIESARILKLPLSTFDEMGKHEKAEGHMYPVYKAIFKAARVTEPVPDRYCLLFKFEDE